MQLIILKYSFKILSINKLKKSFSFFTIFEQLSIVFHPKIIDICTIFIMIISFKISNLVIKYFTFTMKIIDFPLALICNFSIWIIKCSKSIHLIIKPISMIFTSINIEKGSKTISFIIFNFTNIFSS